MSKPPEQGTPAWREWRRGGYGASDAPTLVLGNERAWQLLHAEKLGILPDPEATEPMRWGVLLENVIAKRYEEETGERVERRATLVQHPDLPMVRASLDRRRRRGRVVVEIKVYGYRTDDFGPDGSDLVPEGMYYQVQQQLAASGWDRADLAVYFGVSRTKRLGIFRIGRDDGVIDDLLALEEENWAFVAAGRMPPWPGPAPERVRLLADEVPPTATLLAKLAALDVLAPKVDELERQREELRSAIRAELEHVGGTRGKLPDGRAFSISYRYNRDGTRTSWQDVATGYRKRLTELGVSEAELDLPVSALTIVQPGARPLRINVRKESTNGTPE